jgi:hypothetical protein
MYSGPVNVDMPETNSVESIIATGEKISSYFDNNDVLVCEVFRFEHTVDGWKHAVIFYDGSYPCDFTDVDSAESYAESAALSGFRM